MKEYMIKKRGTLLPLSFIPLPFFLLSLEKLFPAVMSLDWKLGLMFSFSCAVRPNGVKEHQNKQSLRRGNEREYCLGAQTQQLRLHSEFLFSCKPGSRPGDRPKSENYTGGRTAPASAAALSLHNRMYWVIHALKQNCYREPRICLLTGRKEAASALMSCVFLFYLCVCVCFQLC